MKSRAGQHLRDLSFAEQRACQLEVLDDVAHEVRELVDRLANLDERIWAILVDALQPGGYGRWFDEKSACRLCQRPASRRFELEDGHSFGGRVVWTSPWIDPGNSGVLDADLLADEGDFLPEPIVLGGQPDPSVDAVGRPAAGCYDSVVGQGNDVDDGGSDAVGPAGGQWDICRNVILQRWASRSRRLCEGHRIRYGNSLSRRWTLFGKCTAQRSPVRYSDSQKEKFSRLCWIDLLS